MKTLKRIELVETIHQNLTKEDKAFLLSFNRLEPDWEIYDFQQYPSVRWKLLNLQKLRETTPEKFNEQCELLKRLFHAP